MLSDAQQHGGQAASGDVNELLGKLAEAYQTIDELQRPFNDGDAGHASASAWSHSAQPTPADAPPPQGDAACGSLYRTKPDEDEPPARVYPAVNGLDN
jgi:hypothetical protein